MVVTFILWVHIRVQVASHGMIECGMMWHDMDKNLITFIHLTFKFKCKFEFKI